MSPQPQYDPAQGDNEIDRLLSARLQEAADTWELNQPTASLPFDLEVRTDTRHRSRRLLALTPAIVAAAVVVLMVVAGRVMQSNSTASQEIIVSNASELKVELAEQRLAQLAEQQQAIEIQIQRLDMRLRQQQLALERFEREHQRNAALATLDAVDTYSDGLLPEESRERIRRLTDSFRPPEPTPIDL